MTLLVLIFLKIVLFFAMTMGIKSTSIIMAIFTALISVFILSIIELVFKEHSKKVKIFYYIVLSLIMFIDVSYFSYFQVLPSLSMLGQAKQLGAVKEVVKDLIGIKNLLLVLDIPVLIYLSFKKENKINYNLKQTVKKTAIMGGLIIIFIIAIVSMGVSPMFINQELYSYHISDIYSTYIKDDSVMLDKEVIERVFEKDNDSLNIEDRKHYGIGEGKNLIVIQLESFQDFAVNLDYNGQEVTPVLNELIGDGSTLYFDDYFQLIGRGNTSDAEFITHNSLHPSMEDTTYSQYAENIFYGLPSLLKDVGYTPWVFHGYEKEFWNRAAAYPNQGFERFVSEEDYEFTETIGLGISDKDFYNQTLGYLKELDDVDDNPFYSFVITLSSHTPYTIDDKYHVLDLKEEQKDNIVGDYLQSVHYADKELGKFIEGLKEEGLYEDSVIALYGDHYGVNNADETVFEPMKDILGEKYDFDHIMNIPLVIHVPGTEINETISKTGSQLDFYPTILNIMGLENEKGYMMGKDLVNYEGYNYVSPQTMMRKGSFIDKDVIFNMSSDGIFKNSTVVDRKTREQVDVERFRDRYDNVINKINNSDIILKNDLIKDLLKAGGNIDKININGLNGGIEEQKTIPTFKDYTLEELNKSFKENNINRIYVSESSTDLKELESWMEKNKDALLILKSDNDETILEKIKDEYPDLVDRYIGEIDNFDQYFLTQRGGYKKMMLDSTEQNYNDDEIIDFITLYNHFGVIVKNDASEELKSSIVDTGAKVYKKDSKDNLVIEK